MVIKRKNPPKPIRKNKEDIKYVGYVLPKHHFMLGTLDLSKQPDNFVNKYESKRNHLLAKEAFAERAFVKFIYFGNDEEDYKLMIDQDMHGIEWWVKAADTFETKEEALANIEKSRSQLFRLLFSGHLT
jgi:hypothetical protein